jgi:hypothetical protein
VSSTKHFQPVPAAANLIASQRHAPDQRQRQRPAADGGGVVDTLSEWEQARRRNASKRGYEYIPTNCMTQSYSPTDTDCLRIDGELARMCGIGFKHAPALQRWVILNDMNRATGQQGYTFADLEARLTELGVKGGTVYNRRIIRKGIGFYWDYDPHTDKIFPTGYVELTQRVLQYAHDLGLHDLYASGNHPGQQRFMYVCVKGSSADFEGACLAAWCAAHNCPTITRFTLRHLFNRDRRSFWKLERRTGIRVIPNEAETTDPAGVPLDSNGYPRGDVRQEGNRWRYRMANTYQPSSLIRQHHRRGQSRRAAYSFKQWFASIELHTDCQGRDTINRVPVKLNPTGRTYCKDNKAANLSRKRGNTATLFVRCKPGRGRGVVWTVNRLDDNM